MAKYHIKTWDIDSFTANSDWKKRILLIERLSEQLKSWTLTTHHLENHTLTQNSQFIQGKLHWSFLPINEIIPLLLSFSEDLELASKLGFIHGDINLKNILFTKERILLIDYEPSLYHIKNNRLVWKVTVPWVSHSDLLSKEITILTDKLSFLYLVYKLLLKESFPKIKRFTSFKLRHDEDLPIFLDVCDKTVEHKSFIEIANHGINSSFLYLENEKKIQ